MARTNGEYLASIIAGADQLRKNLDALGMSNADDLDTPHMVTMALPSTLNEFLENVDMDLWVLVDESRDEIDAKEGK